MSDKTQQLATYMLGSVAVASVFCIVLLIALPIPVAALLIGIKYQNRNNCPLEPRISLFLIVQGASLIAWILLTMVISLLAIYFKNRRGPQLPILIILITLSIWLLNIFKYIWLMLGAIWTFSIVKKVQFSKQDENNYCHQTLYKFAYIYLIVLSVAMILESCCQVLRCCCSRKEDL